MPFKSPIPVFAAVSIISACLCSHAVQAAGQKPVKAIAPKNIDHSQMGHQQMDHSQMNHGQIDHSKMDHSQMGHQQIDHSQMNHGQIDHSKMEHSLMPHDQPANTEASNKPRNPNAYANGYGFGPLAHSEMGDQNNLVTIIADRLEGAYTHGQSFLTYDWQASYGQAYNKVLARAEGEISEGQFRDARTELLWAHAITPFWDSHLGLRYDTGKGTDRGWLAMGVQGLAPYWLYVEATFYVNEQGRTSFRLETEYDILITQKLILQPRVEMNFYSQTDVSRGVSSGLSNVEAGARLRYEIVREFAPYIGVEWSGRFGSAANGLNGTGEVAKETRLVAGVHFWF